MPMGTVIVGPMWCDKTTQAVMYGNRAILAGRKLHYVRHKLDTREHDPRIVRSRTGAILLQAADIVQSEQDLLDLCAGSKVLIIDEGQINKPSLAGVLLQLVQRDQLFFSYYGLDTTWRGQGFATTVAVMGLPGVKVFRQKAVCAICGLDAQWSQKLRGGQPINILDPDEPTFQIGSEDLYRPLCHTCWFKTTPGADDALRNGKIGIVDPETEWRDRLQ